MVISNMKPRDIQRTGRDAHSQRVTGDAPSLGNVTRLRDKEMSRGTWRRRKRGEGGGRPRETKGQSKMLVVWSVVFAVVVFAVIGGAMWVKLLPMMKRDGAAVKKNGEPVGKEARVVSRFESPSQEAALELVKQALAVRDADKVTAYFRVGTTSPETVVGFLRDMEDVDGAIKEYVWLSSMDANGLLLDGVAVYSQIGDKKKDRLALLTPDESGRWKIDYDAFARTVKPSWSEILAPDSRHGLVRVLFEIDNYYNGPFKDEKQWTCYRLGCPELKDDLLGYCRKGSPQAVAMARIQANSSIIIRRKKLCRATLEICRTEGAELRQFEITRVLAEDWVVSSTPFDEDGK
jgi:hypothetical protein